MHFITPTQFEAFVRVLGHPELVKVSYRPTQAEYGSSFTPASLRFGFGAAKNYSKPAALVLPKRMMGDIIALYGMCVSPTGDQISPTYFDADGMHIGPAQIAKLSASDLGEGAELLDYTEKVEFTGASWTSPIKEGSERTVVIKPAEIHVRLMRGPKQGEKIADPKLEELVRVLEETDAARVIYPPHSPDDYQDIWVNMWKNRT